MKRKEQAALSRQKLLVAAQQIIALKGYEETTVTDITKACKLSVGSFYHYFSSKEELFTCMEKGARNVLAQDVQSAPTLSVNEKLYRYLRGIADESRNRGINFARAWIRHYVAPCSNPPNKMDILAKEILWCLQSGVDSGELRPDTPLDELSYSIAFAMIGALTYGCMLDDDEYRLRWVESYCCFLEKVMLPPYYTGVPPGQPLNR